MQQEQSVIQSHEMFYRGDMRLEANLLTCGDDRTEAGIRMFGGGANPIFQLTVMEEIYKPGSITGKTFESDIRTGVKVLKEVANCKPAVHSQFSTEQHDSEISADNSEDIGCAWIKLRQTLSQNLSDNRVELLRGAKTLRPELFTDEKADDFATKYFDASARIAAANDYFSTGRKVAVEAAKAGAATINVRGEHAPNADGEINLVENEGMDGAAANAAGLPAYDHSSWATAKIYQRLNNLYPYDARELAIADLLDTLNTLDALNVQKRAVRRPQAN